MANGAHAADEPAPPTDNLVSQLVVAPVLARQLACTPPEDKQVRQQPCGLRARLLPSRHDHSKHAPPTMSQLQLQKALARVMVEFGNLEKLHPTISKDIVSEMFARLAQHRGPPSQPLPPGARGSASRVGDVTVDAHGTAPLR
jgi:hypothetical protein